MATSQNPADRKVRSVLNRRNFVRTTVALGAARTAAPAQQAAGTAVSESMLHLEQQWGAQHYDEKEREQLLEVLDRKLPFRWYGPRHERPVKVLTFEREFAARMQTKYALAVNSGTSALEAAVTALGVGPGDEVIIPAWTWHSSATSVIRAGALPVFCEIDESFNIDPARIEALITPATKAVMAVHLQGNPADMDRIMAVARKRGLKVLEDCAQAVGGSYKGRPLGSIGDIGIYSHQVNKTISAGEGGSVVTNDPLLFERAVRFHDVGSLRAAHEELLGKPSLDRFGGSNFRMSEFTGGVMLAQLRKLDNIIGASRRNAHRVYDGVRDLPGIRFRLLPDPDGETGVAVFLGFDSKEKCKRYIDAIKAEGIPCRGPGGSVVLPVESYIEKKQTPHPAWPTWNSPRGRSIQYGAKSCPRTLDILARFGGININPKYTRRDTDFIVAAIRKVYPRVVGA